MRPKEISSGVFWLPVNIANVYFVGQPGKPWVLIDTSVAGRARQIRTAAEIIHGEGARPSAILLTHGHMDHAGSAAELADLWDVPIYVHALEKPFVSGQLYPPTDPTVGGFLAMMARFVSPKPIDLGSRVRMLTLGEVPGLPGWEWHHTPGHAPGHVAFFRRRDGMLIGGDAVTTVNLDSFLAIATKHQRVSGPPAPSTYDWVQACDSVGVLADLRPSIIAVGHGNPMSGSKAVLQLAELATAFPVPAQGRYVQEPARIDAAGIVSLPAKPPDVVPNLAIAIGIAGAAGTVAAIAAHHYKRKKDDVTADTPIPAS